MSIFGKIKDAIFGKKAEAATPPAAPATTASPAAPQPVPTAPAAVSEVDVEAILTAQNAYATQPLNWRTSLVDLLKLHDRDSSPANRRELEQDHGTPRGCHRPRETHSSRDKAVEWKPPPK